MKLNIFSLLRNTPSYHAHWPLHWHSPEPKRAYDIIIIGGDGHGLATAYYLAKNHGITQVAVLEKSWLGSGNTGRHTAIVRCNDLEPDSVHFYQHSLQLWAGLAQELRVNRIFSQRGLIDLLHSEHDLYAMRQRCHALRLNGIDTDMLTLSELQTWLPALNLSRQVRYPVLGGAVQKRAGSAHPDAVAWGYARAADARGVDIIQNCEVSGFLIENNQVHGVATTRGLIRANKVALVAAGHANALAAKAGLRLPLANYPLQTFVSEPLKPVLDCMVASATMPVYFSQSDQGELVITATHDNYPAYGQCGNFPLIEDAVRALLELFPRFSRVKLLRTGNGMVDVTPDARPLIAKLPVQGLYINSGWGTGSGKAIPGSGHIFADTLANDRPHPLAEPFGLQRFESGQLINASAAAGVEH